MILALAAIVVVCGVVVALVGVRGRAVPPHAACVNCDFDLTGIWMPESLAAEGRDEAIAQPPPPVTTPCPECGGALNAGSVKDVQRNSRKGLVLGGVLTSLIGVAIAVLPAVTGTKLATLKPTAWLIADIRGAGIGTANEAAVELATRVKGGRFDAGQLERAVDAILARQADARKQWPAEAGVAVFAWHGAGLLSPDDMGQFLVQGMPLQLAPGPLHLEQGEEITAYLREPPHDPGPRLGIGQAIWYRAYPAQLSIDGSEVAGIRHDNVGYGGASGVSGTLANALARWSPMGSLSIAPGSWGGGHDPAAEVNRVARAFDPIIAEVGSHELHIEYVVEYGVSGNPGVVGRTTLMFDRTIAVHQELASAVTWEANVPEVTRLGGVASLTVPQFSASWGRGVDDSGPIDQVWSLSFDSVYRGDAQLRTAFAGDVVLRIRDRQWRLCHVAMARGWRGSSIHGGQGVTVAGIQAADWVDARVFLVSRATAMPHDWRVSRLPTLLRGEVELESFGLRAIQAPMHVLTPEQMALLHRGGGTATPFYTMFLDVIGGRGKTPVVTDRTTELSPQGR